RYVQKNQDHVRKVVTREKKLDYYEGLAHFVDGRTMEINGEKLKARRIFLATGSRTVVPPIAGLDTVDYLTNETLLKLDDKPESLIIIGGGYIAVEYGHFFAAMGTKVTILEMADRLVLSEEPEISDVLKKQLSKRMDIFTGELVQKVEKGKGGKGVKVTTKSKTGGTVKEYTAEKVLLAVGRKSNADRLNVEKAGIQLDERGFIKVDGYMQTTHRGIFAVGDINGIQMFTHAANVEAFLCVDHVLHGARRKMDYSAAPHAVFSYPQIASVGMTEEKAKAAHKVEVGRARYREVAYGEAMLEREGFARAVIEKDTDKVLGFHIIGPHAAILIQEVVNAMQAGGHMKEIFAGMHIHPALAELIPAALGNG
ncbi:MAG: FAD-dependent oxidoreductase, partial [Syntrophales bacterium]|nr:FAD-dependent oxidoreductase [Syntrophales bacterium]